MFQTLSVLKLFFNETWAKMLLLSASISIHLLIKNVEAFFNTGSELLSYRYSVNLGVGVNLQAKCTTIFFLHYTYSEIKSAKKISVKVDYKVLIFGTTYFCRTLF